MSRDFIGRHRIVQRGAVLLWAAIMAVFRNWFIGLDDPSAEQLGAFSLIVGLSSAGVYKIYTWNPKGKCD